MLTYALAVLAACANAASSVLQRKANRRIPRGQNLSLRLIWNLLHEPVWFGGILAITAGFLLQAAALGTGQLSVVEPILIVELPATLVLASRVFGSPMHRREWGTTVAMTVGLAGLLYFLSPSAGQSTSVPWYRWVTGIGINLVFIGLMVGWARRSPIEHGEDSEPGDSDGQDGQSGGARRAAVLGVAAGAAFGLTAALMKGMTSTFSAGMLTLLTSWPLYAMIASGAFGLFLTQSAMNAGRLLAAQPGLTLSDPIVSVLWGILVFGERVRGGWFAVLAVVSGLVMVAAVVVLARSPVLSGDDEPRRDRAGPSTVGASPRSRQIRQS
jgi:drug/metabolite transporter (DMT)-like permease